MKHTHLIKITAITIALATLLFTLSSCVTKQQTANKPTPPKSEATGGETTGSQSAEPDFETMSNDELYAYIMQMAKDRPQVDIRLEDYPYYDIKFKKGESKTVNAGDYKVKVPKELERQDVGESGDFFAYVVPNKEIKEEMRIAFQLNQPNFSLDRLTDKTKDDVYTKFTGKSLSERTQWQLPELFGSYTTADADKNDREQLIFLIHLLSYKGDVWNYSYTNAYKYERGDVKGIVTVHHYTDVESFNVICEILHPDEATYFRFIAVSKSADIEEIAAKVLNSVKYNG